MVVAIRRIANDPRPADDPRIGLIAEIQEKSFYIPNLKSHYGEWPYCVNPHYLELQEALDARIREYYPAERAEVLVRHDYALLTSIWWPRASAEHLKTCAFWFLWLFTWDDEIDQSTSELFINIQNANQFRNESYHFVRHVLGVPNEETLKWNFDENPPTRPLICSLDIIGANLQKFYNKDQIMVFVDEIYYYMDCQQREQGRKLTGVIPTVEQYLETRLGTSAVTSMLALNEYADEQNLPRWIMTHPLMTDIWREVNLNMSLSNDMMSLRKEIKHGDIDSIVPIAVFNRKVTVQDAIEDTCKELQKNIDRFDSTADELLRIVGEKESVEVVDEVDKYIVGCRYNQMANLLWSLKSERYGLGKIPRDKKGGITITVG